jgi:hypothetical protein
MEDRGADPFALRWMIHHCTACRRSRVPGRFVAKTTYRGVEWEIVLEPDYERECIVGLEVGKQCSARHGCHCRHASEGLPYG